MPTRDVIDPQTVRQSVQNALTVLFLNETKGVPIPEVYVEELPREETDARGGSDWEFGLVFHDGRDDVNDHGFASITLPSLPWVNPKAVAQFLFYGMAAYWSCSPAT
jgi:hypothetical protein